MLKKLSFLLLKLMLAKFNYCNLLHHASYTIIDNITNNHKLENHLYG